MQVIKDFIVPNEYSRPQTALKKVTKIAVHYVGNPMSTAKNNRDYFNNQPQFPRELRRYVSSHYVVGLEGEIIQCIPHNEISYATGAANSYSISIECCHPDVSGKFTEKTRAALVELLSELCHEFGLSPLQDIIRHYDATGKLCPIWYVKNPADWQEIKDSTAAITDKPTIVEPTSDMTLKEASKKLLALGVPIDFAPLEKFLRSK